MRAVSSILLIAAMWAAIKSANAEEPFLVGGRVEEVLSDGIKIYRDTTKRRMVIKFDEKTEYIQVRKKGDNGVAITRGEYKSLVKKYPEITARVRSDGDDAVAAKVFVWTYK